MARKGGRGHRPTDRLTDASGQQDIRRLPHHPAKPVKDVPVEDTLEGSLTGGGDGCECVKAGAMAGTGTDRVGDHDDVR